MATTKKNNAKIIRSKKHSVNKPLRLSPEAYAAKKTEEMNAILEKTIFLPS